MDVSEIYPYLYNMNIKEYIEDLLRELNADIRIKDGIFKISNSDHLNVLREYLNFKIRDSIITEEIINNLIDESEASEQAHKKGWSFKGGYWWDSNGPIARTVDGKLKTLDQIELDRKSEERHKELEKSKILAKVEQDRRADLLKHRSEREAERVIKGVDSDNQEQPVQEPIDQPQVQPKAVPVIDRVPVEDKAAKIAKIRSKVYAQLNKEGKEVNFSAILNDENIVGFVLENGKFVVSKSTEDPRYSLTNEFLVREGWSEFCSL